MPVTWSKTLVTHTNPLDGTLETVIEVNNVKVDNALCFEHFVFPEGTTDELIQTKVEATLAKKGYAVTDPSTPSLADLKRLKKYQFKLRVTSYIGGHYDEGQKQSLLAAWTEGVDKGYTNRKAKIQSVWDWIKTVLSYYAGKLGQVDAAADAVAVNAVEFDLAPFDATDPKVSVLVVNATVD